MSTTVYLIGHGRVNAEDSPIYVTPNVTMHWLGRLGDVTAGMSYAFLSGTLTQVDSSDAGGSSIWQHYLCGEQGDVDDVVDTKIKNFFDRRSPDPHGCPDPWVLYPRGKTNVSLSSIFRFLNMLSPSNDWHLYWTCCRGFVGYKNPYTTKFVKATGTVTRQRRTDPKVTPRLDNTKEKHAICSASFDSVRIVASSDKTAIGSEMGNQSKHQKSQTRAIELLMRV
jgi:hypothetical protein